MKALFLFIFLQLSACTSRPPSLSDELADFCKAHKLPGVAVAYRFDNGITVEGRHGLPDNARMLAGSVGKTFIAAAILRLAGDGLLDLDAGLTEHLGTYPWFIKLPNAKDLTARQLLTHSAGLPDHVHDPRFAEQMRTRWREEEPISPLEQLAFLHDLPPLFPAGEGWGYSDSGYVLLQLLFEELTGEDLFEHIQRTLLAPLELWHTLPSNRRSLPALVQGQVSQPSLFGFPPNTLDAEGRLYWHPGVEGAGGGFLSSAGDLVRWGERLYTGGVLDENGMEDLLAAVPIQTDSALPAYGAGVVVDVDPLAGRSLGHRGWIPGYVTSLLHFPEQGLTLAIQLNSDQSGPDGSPPLIRRLERRILTRLLSE